MEAIAIARQLEQKEAIKNSKGIEMYKYPTPVNSNQELLGQGLGNIASSVSAGDTLTFEFLSAFTKSVNTFSI